MLIQFDFKVDNDFFENSDWKNDLPKYLLISDLFKNLKTDNNFKYVDFFLYWYEFEKQHTIEHSLEILKVLSFKSDFLKSIDILIETIQMISNMNLNEIKNVFKFEQNIYLGFKTNITIKLIENKLEKKINLKYIKQVAQQMSILFDYNFIKAYFNCFTLINNLTDFDFTIEFCNDNHIKTQDLNLITKNGNITDFKQQLIAKYLCNQFGSIHSNDLFNILKRLLNRNWSLEQLSSLITQLKEIPINQIQNTFDFFNLIYKYRLANTNYEKCLSLIRESDCYDNLIEKLNQLLIENNFQSKGKIKTSIELIHELKSLNPGEDFQAIERDLNEIRNSSLKSEICKAFDNNGNTLAINKWNSEHIESWSKEARKTPQFKLNEALAVINQATFITFDFQLNDTQIISSLILLKFNNIKKGRLIQVSTGEGKSIIVCILAIFNALNGNKVHVITSSTVLGK